MTSQAIRGAVRDRPRPWRTRRFACVLAAAAALLVAAAPGLFPNPAHAGESPDDDFFAISAPELLRMSDADETARVEQHLTRLAALGVTTVRVNVSWADYDNFVRSGFHPWRGLDRFVTALAAHGLEMLPVPRGAPYWARAADAASCPDRDRSSILPSAFPEYARFVAAIAARYGPDGAFWNWFSELPEEPIHSIELWNEPNWTAYWCPAPDPEAFARLVAAGADAVTAANPSVDVILGGVVSITSDAYDRIGRLRGLAADDFLRRMVTEVPALPGKLDAVGIHLYEPQASADLERLAWMRDAADRAGFSEAQLAVTEFGWNRLDMSQTAIATNYTDFVSAVTRNADCGVSTIAAHSWATDEVVPHDPEHWWGLADPATGAPYAGGLAYGEQIAAAGTPGAAALHICSDAQPPPLPSTVSTTLPAGASPAQPVTPDVRPSAVEKLSIVGAARTRDHTPTFRFAVPAGIATVCRLDDRAWQECRSPYTAARLGRGSHVLSVRIRDRSGGPTGRREKVRFRIV